MKGNIVEQKNRRNLNGSVKKQNVLQLTSLIDETSEEKNSLFARKGSYLYRPLFGQNSPQTGTRGSRKTFLATLLYNVSQITIPFTQDMDSSG